MPNPYNGSKRGKRGGRAKVSPPHPMLAREQDERPSALRKGLPDRPTKPTDSAVLIDGLAAHYEYTDREETYESALIPRKSLTRQQHLRTMPREIEIADVKTIQYFNPEPAKARVVETEVSQGMRFVNGKLQPVSEKVFTTEVDRSKAIPVVVSNPKVVWKSDRTLLRTDKPDSLEGIRYQRITSRSKEKITERERPATVEVSTENELDIDLDK